MLTENELYWLRVVAEDEKLLEELSNKTNAKRDQQITKKFIDFVKLILKYENLKCGKHLEVHRRLIKVHRNIPTKTLDFKKYEYIIFDGLYVVTDVIFIDPDITRKFFANPTDYRRIELGIPDNVAITTLKLINIDNNNEIGVALLRGDFVDNYIPYPSKWSYPIF